MTRSEGVEHLEAMFLLPAKGLSITGVHVYGAGSRAAARIELSNGEEMVFDSLRDLAKPGLLRAELAACAQVTGKINGDQALAAVSLVSAIGEHHATRSDDEIAAYWGLAYLGSAQTIDVDVTDQAQRWGAFELLDRTDPWMKRTAEGGSLAAAGVVLRDPAGVRYVRCGWFLSHARGEDGTIGPQVLAQRRGRVGWTRRGSRGNVKATSPRTGASKVLAFWTVPAGWEAGWESA